MAFELGKVARGNTDAILLTDYRYLSRELNKIDPSINKGLKLKYRELAQPGQAAVRKAISSQPITSGIHRNDPNRVVSGFFPKVVPGRLTWGTGKPAKSVLIDTKMPKLKTKGFNSIVRLRVGSAATVMADMAGSVGKYDRRKETRPYAYSRSATGMRTHTNNGQGRGMVGALNRSKGRNASRFIYPAFDKAAPAMQAKGQIIINNVVDIFNAEIRKAVS